MNSIESYISRNFITGDNVFTNLLIAIPIIATILLLISNSIRTKYIKHIPNGLFECKFISITSICYAFIVIITNLFNHQLSITIILVLIASYIPFISLSWCIYQECCCAINKNKSIGNDNNPYAGEFTEKIKRKIQEIRKAKKQKIF